MQTTYIAPFPVGREIGNSRYVVRETERESKKNAHDRCRSSPSERCETENAF